MKKIRMIAFNNGEIVSRKYIDIENKMIKEQNAQTREVISYNFEGILQDFGTVEAYIKYNMRVWGYSLLDSLN